MTTLSLLPGATIDWRWVRAAPFRAHVRSVLLETGLPWRALAGYAGVPDRVLHNLLRGHDGRPVKRIAPHYARRLLQLEPVALRAALKLLIPAGASHDAAHLLLGAGWSPAAIAAAAELTRDEMGSLLLGQVARVPRRIEVLLTAAVRAHRLDTDEHAAGYVAAAA